MALHATDQPNIEADNGGKSAHDRGGEGEMRPALQGDPTGTDSWRSEQFPGRFDDGPPGDCGTDLKRGALERLITLAATDPAITQPPVRPIRG